MAIRTMHVRRNPLGGCPVPPRPVRLHRDTLYPATCEHVYVQLNPAHTLDQVTGTYRLSTKTANIEVGSGKWLDLSDWLGSQPFVTMLTTAVTEDSDVESVSDFDCLGPAALAPVARMAPARADVGRDVFALRRDVSSLRSLTADILTELVDMGSKARFERDMHPISRLRLRGQYVVRDEYGREFLVDDAEEFGKVAEGE